jgi:glycosyltransferase involved in cell wall biosynthesis
MQEKIFIVIAAYNEGEKIGKVISSIKKEGYTNIVVVDDGSNDNTYDICEKEKIFALKHIMNRGQGAALKTGIDFAMQNGASIIVTFDADGQFLVKEIKDIISPILSKEADITLGSRFLGKAINIPLLKKIVLKLGVIVVFFLYGIKVTDSQCGFRGISRNAAEKIELKSDRMEHAAEIFLEIMRNNLKYKEIPITVIYDDYSLKKGQDWSRSLSLGLKMLLQKITR